MSKRYGELKNVENPRSNHIKYRPERNHLNRRLGLFIARSVDGPLNEATLEGLSSILSGTLTCQTDKSPDKGRLGCPFFYWK